MAGEGPDDWIKSVFAKAAADPVFLRMLLEDREKALDAVNLSPAEKAILMAVPDEQIEKMVRSARKRPWRNVMRAGMFVGGVAAGLGLTGVVAAPLFATLGHTAELPRAVDAGSVLRQIAHSGTRPSIHGPAGDLGSPEKNAAFRRSNQTTSHAERCRLSRTVRSEQADNFAALDMEIDAVNGALARIILHQTNAVEQWHRLCPP